MNYVRLCTFAICVSAAIAAGQETAKTDPPRSDSARPAVRVVFEPEFRPPNAPPPAWSRIGQTASSGKRAEAMPRPSRFPAGPGITGVRLGEEFTTPMVAVIGDDGKLRIGCGPLPAAPAPKASKPADPASGKAVEYVQ